MKEDSQAGFRRTRLPESNFSIREVKALTYFAIPLLTLAAHGKIPARTAVNPGNGLSLVSPIEQETGTLQMRLQCNPIAREIY